MIGAAPVGARSDPRFVGERVAQATPPDRARALVPLGDRAGLHALHVSRSTSLCTTSAPTRARSRTPRSPRPSPARTLTSGPRASASGLPARTGRVVRLALEHVERLLQLPSERTGRALSTRATGAARSCQAPSGRPPASADRSAPRPSALPPVRKSYRRLPPEWPPPDLTELGSPRRALRKRPNSARPRPVRSGGSLTRAARSCASSPVRGARRTRARRLLCRLSAP